MPIAETINACLAKASVVVRLWTDGVFGASRFPIEDLAQQVSEADFAVLVLGPDDRVISREKESDAPRDNVVFELGLFMGNLGRQRTYLVVPRGHDIKIPTDLLGLTPIQYKPGSDNLIERLYPVCSELIKQVTKAGTR